MSLKKNQYCNLKKEKSKSPTAKINNSNKINFFG